MTPSNFQQLCKETFQEYLEEHTEQSDILDRFKDFVNIAGKVSTHVNEWDQNFKETLEHFQTYTDLDLSDENTRQALSDIVHEVERMPELYY